MQKKYSFVFPLFCVPLVFWGCSDSDSSTKVNSDSGLVAESLGDLPALKRSDADLDNFNSKISYGSMTDDRDGQIYRTIVVENVDENYRATWMAENLNYDPEDVSGMSSNAWSGCYENAEGNCSRYGRFYTWEVAMDNAACAYGSECNPSGDVRGVCPAGWHLPSTDEWNALFTAVGGIANAGAMLKSANGWMENGIGSDAYGFAVIPAGLRNYDGYFNGAGFNANFWSSSEVNGNNAYYEIFSYSYSYVYERSNNKKYGFSVRCLLDS